MLLSQQVTRERESATLTSASWGRWDVATSVYNVYAYCQRTGNSFLPSLPRLLPIVVLLGASYVWLAAPASTVLRQHLFLFIVAAGITFGRLLVRTLATVPRH
jgi:hypothetical protein